MRVTPQRAGVRRARARGVRRPLDAAEVRCLARRMENQEPLRGRRVRILTQLLRYPGWKVQEVYWEGPDGERLDLGPGSIAPPDSRLILCPKRHWAARCSQCFGRCDRLHEQDRDKRRWQELPA